jgi:disulfide bond formation protein DsbB
MHALKNTSYRTINIALFGYSAIMMLVAYFYFQQKMGLMPCPLCVTQRIFAIAFGSIALIAAIHNPAPLKQRFYALMVFLSALGGAAVAGRQVYLQSLPEDQVPACGPTLPYLMEYFPFQDVLNAMFLGEGSCAEIKWQLLGLSIPGWTLVAFTLVLIASLWQLCRKAPTLNDAA